MYRVCVCAFAIAAAPWAFGAAPAALVIQVTGTTQPQLVRHREVAEGTRITLAPQARVSILHYEQCAIVTLTGGPAVVTANGIETAAGNVESTKKGPCPKVHKISLSEGAASGGVSVSRSINAAASAPPAGPLNLAANGVIVLSGAAASTATSYELLDGFNRSVTKKASIKDRAFEFDGSESAHGPYTVRIRFANRPEPLDLQVFLSRTIDGGMLVLEVD
jgi:hypothetical protein